MWEIVNMTADAHPIHLHLVQFQIINRQNFDVGKYIAAYNQAFPGGVFDCDRTSFPVSHARLRPAADL